QFIVESATLSLVGAALGIGAGIGLAFLVQAVSPLPAAVAPWSVAVGVILGISVGIIAVVWPASRASPLDPITALRAEERGHMSPGRVLEGVGIALDSIRASKARAFLTILGVAIGVMVVIAMASAITGINRSVAEQLESLGPKTFFVQRYF